MKTAREVVHEAFVSAVHAGLWAKAIPGCCDPGVTADLHGTDCDDVTAAIEQARRDGAEWMREQAAECAHSDDHIADAIRALPVTP